MSHLAKNLAALRIHTPATAAIVESATIPQGYLAAVGSDHTPTFLRTATEPRELHWLGNTSMPTASAGPLTAALDATAAGLGLSIGTGYEWLAFCLRLGPAQPLYVYEPEGGQLRMALTICDLSEHLASGKIVIFSGSTEVAKDEIARFLSMHAGHEPPAVLHPLATLSAERRNALLAAGESVVRHGLQCRQALVNELAAKMQAVESEKWKGGKIAALIGAAHYSLERPLHFQMASDTPRLRLDQHGSCSLARRLEFVLEHTPGRIVSDFFRPDLGCIPPGIPVHTWVPPLVGPAFWQRLPSPAALLA